MSEPQASESRSTCVRSWASVLPEPVKTREQWEERP